MKTKSAKKQNPSVDDRMNFLIGHLKANLKMHQEGRYCIDIIRQNQAVISALKKVNEEILRNHLNTCVTSAIRVKSENEKEKVFTELMEVFQEEERTK